MGGTLGVGRTRYHSGYGNREGEARFLGGWKASLQSGFPTDPSKSSNEVALAHGLDHTSSHDLARFVYAMERRSGPPGP
jgi:hypothetical protein